MDNIFVQVIINIALLGAVYALVGVGMSIIYGVMKIVNFAHGEFLVLGAYAAVSIYAATGLGPLTSLFIVVPGFFLLGLAIYKLIIPRLLAADDPETASFLAFFGISMMIVYGMIAFFGATPKGIPYPYENIFPAAIAMGDMYVSASRLISALTSATVIAWLLYFLQKTHTGKAIRALIQNRDAAKILGIDTEKISAWSFGLGMALLAASGVLMTLVFPSISPKIGSNYTTLAFAVVVLGGLKNPTGALFGGILFAAAENISSIFLPAGISSALAFIILILTIICKPEGLVSDVKFQRKAKQELFVKKQQVSSTN